MNSRARWRGKHSSRRNRVDTLQSKLRRAVDALISRVQSTAGRTGSEGRSNLVNTNNLDNAPWHAVWTTCGEHAG